MVSDFQVLVSRVVRDAKVIHGWTNADLTAVLGISSGSVNAKLNGVRRWTLDECKEFFSRFLDVAPEFSYFDARSMKSVPPKRRGEK